LTPRELIRRVRRIEIRTRRLVEESLAGAYHSLFKGRGMEFAEVREYVPGDDVRTIDWNVSARMGHPFVKKFTEERELTVVLLVDASASGRFGTGVSTKVQMAAEISALLTFSALRNNDRVGLMLFTDEIELALPPRNGREHGLRVLREVLAFEPAGRGTNIDGVLQYRHDRDLGRRPQGDDAPAGRPGGRRRPGDGRPLRGGRRLREGAAPLCRTRRPGPQAQTRDPASLWRGSSGVVHR